MSNVPETLDEFDAYWAHYVDHVLEATPFSRWLLAAFRTIAIDDFRRPRRLPEYEITPEWTLHHLMQHEAEHRGELASMRARAELEM